MDKPCLITEPPYVCDCNGVCRKEWNEDRIDVIGSNGNEGLHYIEPKKSKLVGYTTIEIGHIIPDPDQAYQQVQKDYEEK